MSGWRRAAALAAASTFLGACSSGDGDPRTLEPPAEESNSPAPTADAPEPGEATDGEPGGPGPGPSAGTGGTVAPPPAAPPATEPATDPGGPPGSFAPTLLRADRSARLVVEVLAQSGAEPAPGTVEHVVGVLGDVAAKPVDVAAGTVPGGARSWTADEIRSSAAAAGTAHQGDGRAVVRLLFLAGGMAGNDTALGLAVRGDVAAVFPDRVREASSPLVGRGAIEAAVTTHEVGHLLGLVDLHLDTGRADPEHPGHSPNRGSVMYWAVESSLVADVLRGGPPRDFDADDRADLAAIRSGA